MGEGTIYDVRFNFTRKSFRRVSFYLFAVSMVGFAIWYVIDLPVRYAPGEISILYYFGILPKWLLDVFAVSIFLAIAAFAILDIRGNVDAVLHVLHDAVLIERMNKMERIAFKDLKRISLVAKMKPLLPFTKNLPYRVEFASHGNRLRRVVLFNKADFYRLLENLHAVIPEELEINATSFESIMEENFE